MSTKAHFSCQVEAEHPCPSFSNVKNALVVALTDNDQVRSEHVIFSSSARVQPNNMSSQRLGVSNMSIRLPIVSQNLSILPIDHFRHRAKLVLLASKLHALAHNPSIILSRRDLS